ncbi:MAG: PAS domain-containing protein [Caldilineaceae bacterium]
MRVNHTHASSLAESEWLANTQNHDDARPSVDRLNVFAELSEDAFYTCWIAKDGTPVIDWVSPTFEQLIGTPFQPFNRLDQVLEFVAPSGRQGLQQQITLALTGQESRNSFHIHSQSQPSLLVEHRLRPERSQSDGPVVRLYGLLRPAQKLELNVVPHLNGHAPTSVAGSSHNNEERLQALLKTLPDAIAILNEEGICTQYYPGQPSSDYMPPEKVLGVPLCCDMPINGLINVHESGNLQQIEFASILQGQPHWFEARIIPLGESGKLALVRNVTEQKRAVEALRLSEERNRALLQAIPDMMFLVDRNGYYVDVHTNNLDELMTPALKKNLEDSYDVTLQTASQLKTSAYAMHIGKHTRDVVPAPLADRFLAANERALTTNMMEIVEYSFPFEDGERFFEARIVPCGNDKVLSIVRNITARKNDEAALRTSEEQNRALLRASPDLLIVLHRSGKYLALHSFSDADLFRPREEMLGKNVRDFVSPSEYAASQYYIHQVLATGEMAIYESSHQFDEGVRYFESRMVPYGKDTVISMVRNITRHKQIEEQLRLQNALLKAQLDATPEGILAVDTNRNWIGVNQQFIDLWSMPEEIINKRSSLASLEHVVAMVENPDEFRESVERVYPDKLGELFDEVKLKDGRVFERRSRPILTPDHQVLGRVWLYYDVTHSKQAAESIHKLNEQLQSASRLKDEFLKNISHEFRTPLTVILTLSETLSSGRFGLVSEQQNNTLHRIQKQSRNLLEMVNNLLDMATLLSGTVELHLGPVSLNDLCKHALYLAQPAAQSKKLSLSCEIAPDVKSLEADERRLGQVIQTLLHNAIKFTPEGGQIGIEVRSEPTTSNVEIIIWDTGIGVLPEDAKRMFQPFVQLDTTLSRRHEGAGLGLALAAHLTEMHNGTIMVESLPGQGARFIISLPRNSTKKQL